MIYEWLIARQRADVFVAEVSTLIQTGVELTQIPLPTDLESKLDTFSHAAQSLDETQHLHHRVTHLGLHLQLCR